MGNLLKSMNCCGCVDEIIRSSCYREFLYKGLFGPDGTMISLEGLYIDCRINKKYLDGTIEVSFSHNIAGKSITSTRYIIINNKDHTIADSQGIVRLKIIEDRTYVLIAENIASTDVKEEKQVASSCSIEQEEAKVVNYDESLVDRELVRCGEQEDVTPIENDDIKMDPEVVCLSSVNDDMDGSSVIENFKLYEDHAGSVSSFT